MESTKQFTFYDLIINNVYLSQHYSKKWDLSSKASSYKLGSTINVSRLLIIELDDNIGGELHFAHENVIYAIIETLDGLEHLQLLVTEDFGSDSEGGDGHVLAVAFLVLIDIEVVENGIKSSQQVSSEARLDAAREFAGIDVSNIVGNINEGVTSDGSNWFARPGGT